MLRQLWTAFRSRSRAEQKQLLGRAWQRLRRDGVAGVLAWARHGSATARQRDGYDTWVRRHTPDAAALEAMRARASSLRRRPTISLITAAYNTPPALLDAAADSVLAQAYPYWEWHIADDGSTAQATVEGLRRLAYRDPRISVHRSPSNGGISSASNLALSKATGDYVALMDHDDALLPHALFRVAEILDQDDEPDVVYSDEDKLDLDGRRCDPYFKPDWSPDLFRSSMYACHLLVIRRALVHEVGGFRSAFDFSQDYDLLLRVIERTARIAHVPDVLYHWRKTLASTALAGDAKPDAHAAGARALQAHLDRQGIAGRILDAGPPGLYRVQYTIPGTPRVSILLPTRDPAGPQVAAVLEAVAATTAGTTVEVLLVSGSQPAGGAAVPPRRGAPLVRSLQVDGRFHLARWVNVAAAAASGDHLLVLHDDVQPHEPGWMEAMLELAVQPWIGAVGAKLLGPDGTLQHVGLVLGLGGLAGAPFRGFAADTVGYYSGANCIRNYSAVSGACLMTRRDVFERVGGFDEALSGPGADVDYGLRVGEAGLRVVFTPYATLTHTMASGLTTREPSPEERAHLRARWGARLDTDPYYNPNLSREALDYRIAGEPSAS
jgi:GT2 family glycosyltransferase